MHVTAQSQLVTSYVPQFTLCQLPSGDSYPVTMQLPATAPYKNYSMPISSGNSSCTTIYSETETMVCATTLSDLTTTYTVTQCPQDITFSTRFFYTLATPTGLNGTAAATGTGLHPFSNASAMITPAPTIQTLTTYYLAPWQELTSAGPPADVDLKVCSALVNGTEQCVRQYEVWQTSLVTSVMTTFSACNFTTSIGGPSQLIVETFVANVTELMTTISMSTTMALEYETEIETTSTSTRPVSTGPTITQTISLEEALVAAPCSGMRSSANILIQVSPYDYHHSQDHDNNHCWDHYRDHKLVRTACDRDVRRAVAYFHAPFANCDSRPDAYVTTA